MIGQPQDVLGICTTCGKAIRNDGEVTVRFRFRKEEGEQVPDGVEFSHQDCVDDDWRWSSHEEFEANDETAADGAAADPDTENDESKPTLAEFLTLEIDFLSRQIEERAKLEALISVQEGDLESAKLQLVDEQDEGEETAKTEAEIAQLTVSLEQLRVRLIEIVMIIRHAKHWTSVMREHGDNLEEFYEDDDLIDWRSLEMAIGAKVSTLAEIEAEEAKLAEIVAQGKGDSRKAQRIRDCLKKARSTLAETEAGIVEQKVQMRGELDVHL